MKLATYVLVFLISSALAIIQDDSNNSSIKAFVYLNIAQTGGNWLLHQIPLLLNLTSCNKHVLVPNSRSFANGKAPNIDILRYPIFGPIMNTSLASKYLVLSSFREPCSRFFASFVHATTFGKINVSLSKYIEDHSRQYDLHDFQIKFMLKNI